MKNRKNIITLIVIAVVIVLIVVVGILALQISKQYGELAKVEKQLTKSNEELYVLLTREISLFKKLSTRPDKELSEKCNSYSYECVVEASKIRQTFLDSLAITYYPDSDMELLTMISSVDATLNAKLDEYNNYVEDYAGLSEKQPLKIWLIISFQDDKYKKL